MISKLLLTFYTKKYLNPFGFRYFGTATWWVIYIENNKWEWHYGFSGMIEVPKLVEKKLYEDWLELWPIMNELSWRKNIWNENWSLWEWSANMLTRKDEFSLAFKAAISPFYNEYYKM